MFLKTFPFWIVKTRDCLVLKFTREVSISSSAKNAFIYSHSVLPLQCFKKTFHFWIVKTRDSLVHKFMRDLFSIELRGRENIKDYKKMVLHTIELRGWLRVNLGSNLNVNENACKSVSNKRF